MALIKEIELENGVILNYHRITSLNKITNINNIIEVSSYVNKNQRIKEKDNYEHNNEIVDIYINTQYISTPYDDTMTIVDAYNYLKTTEKYNQAQDDIEV